MLENIPLIKKDISLLNLFDTTSLIEEIVDERKKDEFYLTDAAKLGLHLAVRGVLDLWQLAYWVTNDHTILKDRRAEKIARTMLRNIITESTMSSELGWCLQERIIRRTHEGKTKLDYLSTREPLEVNRLSSLDFDLPEVVRKRAGYAVRSRLEVNKFTIMVLRSQHSQQGDGRAYRGDVLPDLVTAWLTVLHDTVVWSAEDSEILQCPDIGPPSIVHCWHKEVEVNTKNPQPRSKPKRSERVERSEWVVPK
jgi:hypothetical protein